MANETPRFHLTTLDSANDTLAYRSDKFGTADRELLDRLITQIAENHHHTGAAPVGADVPPPAPQLVVNPIGGSIPANVPVSYRYALVDVDHETIGSLAGTIYTPPQVPPPVNGPVLDRAQGVLMTGDYLYAVSAYTYDPIRETPASTAIRITLIEIAGVTVTLPSPPSGATGWNIYRKGPTDRDLHYLLSVDISVTSYQDNGSATLDPLRGLPTANTTSSSNSIWVRPGASLPAGTTWKVFRTYNSSTWDDTLVVWSAESEVVDTGWSPQTGSPLGGGTALGSPPKIDLGRETTGAAPSSTTPTSEVVEFTFAGAVHPGFGSWQWVNDFDRARVLNVRAHLGRGATPGSQPVKVALERSRVGAITWRRYTDSNGDPLVSYINPGQSLGSRVDVAGHEGSLLYPGYSLRPAILQSGGAPESDTDLVVSVQLAVKHGLGASPEEQSLVLSADIEQFSPPDFKRTHPWFAPQDGTLTNVAVVLYSTDVNWQIQLDILVNDTIVYTSDPFLVPDYHSSGTSFSPERAMPFFRDDCVQFQIRPLNTSTNPYSAITIRATVLGMTPWTPSDIILTWYPLSTTGDPFGFTFIGGTYGGTLTSASQVEVDLPAGLQRDDMIVIGARAHWELTADSELKIFYVHDWGTTLAEMIPMANYGSPGIGPDSLLLRAIRYTPTATKILVVLQSGVVERLDASVVAFHGPERIYAEYSFGSIGYTTYNTYDGAGDGIGIWLHAAMDLPSDIVAGPGTWLLEADGGPALGVSFFNAGTSATSPNVTWTAASSWALGAQVIELLGFT